MELRSKSSLGSTSTCILISSQCQDPDYADKALWEVKQEEISAEESAKIVEPAQVLIMTVTQKRAEDIAVFNEAVLGSHK